MERMEQVLNLAQTMQKAIFRTSAESFIQSVKMDHMIWKNDIYRVVTGVADASSIHISDEHSCTLGHWYNQGNGQKKARIDSAMTGTRMTRPTGLSHGYTHTT